MTFGLRQALEKVDRSYSAYIFILLAAMYLFGQLSDPFIAHDEYDWLVQSGFDDGFESPWSKTLSEGRWLNYPWSFITHWFTTQFAFFFYLVLSAIAAILASQLLVKRSSMLSALVVFFAPMAAITSLWPVTQSSGLIVFIVSMLMLLSATEHRHRLTALFFGVFLSFFCYPSFGPVLLVLYAAQHETDRRSAFLGLITYVTAFVASVIAAFTLNLIFHDIFRIVPAAWRLATPLVNGGTLYGNLIRYCKYLVELETLAIPAIGSLIAYALCFLKGIGASKCRVVLVFAVALFAMDAALAIFSGLDLPMRASLWIWYVLAVPVVFLFSSGLSLLASTLPMFIIVLSGLWFWNSQFAPLKNVYPAMRKIGMDLTNIRAANAEIDDKVIIFGNVKKNPSMSNLHSNKALRYFLYKNYGIRSKNCSPSVCAKIESTLNQVNFVSSPYIILNNSIIMIASRTDMRNTQ